MSYNNKNNVWGGKHPQGANQMGSMSNLNHSGMVPFQPQQQVFQNMGLNQQNLGLNQQNLGLGLQQMAANQLNFASNPIFQQQLSAVSYPNTRGLNPNAFQTQTNVQSNSAGGTKQKVFTGSITQLHENFGFIDDEVFFSRNVCLKGSTPMVGDRVLVEAAFNPSMPFKWNATRVQVMPNGPREQRPVEGNNTYPRRDFSRDPRTKPSVGERRNRSRERDDDEIERKRRREDRIREREKEDKERKSPVRRRSRSPKARRRTRTIPRYMVQIPKISLNLTDADLLELKKRYPNLYIPSDFFNTYIRWVDAFPADKPYALNRPCSFHIMYKELDPIGENDAVLEPADADYRFSAKVMLMSVPVIEEIYQKCCAIAEDKDSRDRESEDRDHIHPTRMINFLVGLRGKNETMAIGGPWSPSLDGENPEKDPAVLIKTAIRTCKALTGIDLSNCTQWYRFVELYYRRGETTHKGKAIPARVETVVIFLPDVWSCLPTRLEWEEVQLSYRKHLEKIIKTDAEETEEADIGIDDKEEDNEEVLEPTLHSELNPKAMTVVQLRTELKARKLDFKGLKAQLVARLTKALKSEADREEEDPREKPNSDGEAECEKDDAPEASPSAEKDKKSEPEEKKLDEVQKRRLEKQYTLPDQPHLIVHPSKVAKSGKFDCTSMSLSLLLDYRPEDTKEHSFEVSLFAELFNEMLMRDFGFNIFKALYQVPEKPKEKEEDRRKKDEKKKKDDDKKDEKSDDESRPEENTEPKKEDDDKKKDRKSDSSDEDDDDGRRSTKDKKKKDRVKLITKDKHLLLSFVYFDQSHCGYIFDKDMEELLYTLGLSLSRSQVKKIVNKVVTRDTLHYRKLTDKPKEEEKEELENGEKHAEIAVNWHEIALGNKKLLPVFEEEASKISVKPAVEGGKPLGSEDLVVYQGAVVDIGKLLSQLDRSEKARIETEQCLIDLKTENHKLSDKYSKSSSTIKHLNSEIKEYKDKLRSTEDVLGRSNAHSKLFQTTLMDIRDKIEPVLKTASHKDDRKDRERDNDKKKDRDDGKSRWEKDGSRKDGYDKDKKEHGVKKEVKDQDIKKEKKEDDAEVKVKKEVDDVQPNEEKL
ncbi:cell division cycle and apoptosis regulator protein 1 [Dendroctonus ponderosae]|uniref:SAP domain-containing protein n=1 Tax=Dendroctonus ponderosae TaxID=77166 RepID=A0AAR5P5H6_DENPD|nr:cell division cycle and apoptosis regulator protein 1 [Dendroctonus ponderosae]